MSKKSFYSLPPDEQAKRRKKEAKLFRKELEKVRKKNAKRTAGGGIQGRKETT